MRDSVEILRGVLGGERFEYDGKVFSADIPALSPDAHVPRWDVPVYVAGTAPLMQQLGGEIGDGLLTPSITTPDFVRYTLGNVRDRAPRRRAATRPRSTSAAPSSPRSTRPTATAGRDGAREIAGMYLANKVQNIQGSADTLLDLAKIDPEEIRPVAVAMEEGGRLAAKAKVTDSILDRCKPIAGTPDDCIAAIEEYRAAGCTHVMLELWGADRHEQIRLFGETGPPATCARERMSESRSTATGSSSGRAGRSATPSFTGDEQAMAELMRETFLEMGLQVQWQQVEDGRANVLGIREGSGGGPSLMFNGHMDTSYSGREPWLAGVPGFQPAAFVEDGSLFGLGISNMKGALACYVEALRALAGRGRDAARRLHDRGRLRRDREDAVRRRAGRAVPRLRGRLALPRRATAASPTCASSASRPRARSCSATSARSGCASSTQGNFIHTAFCEGKRDQNSILRMREVMDAVLEWIPTWEADPENAYRGASGARQRRRDPGRLRLARLAHAAPHRPLPRRARAADASRWRSRAARCSTWCATWRGASRTTASRARST